MANWRGLNANLSAHRVLVPALLSPVCDPAWVTASLQALFSQIWNKRFELNGLLSTHSMLYDSRFKIQSFARRNLNGVMVAAVPCITSHSLKPRQGQQLCKWDKGTRETCIATLGGRGSNKEKELQRMKLGDQDRKMVLQTETGHLK